MNKLNISNTDKKIYDENDCQKILQNAENIILASNKAGKHAKSKKFFLFFLVPVLVLLILILLLSTIFALMNINNTKILNGVYIHGIDVSNLSEEEARNKIATAVNSHISKEITAKYNNFEAKFSPEQFAVNFDINGAVSEAYSLGRSNNIFKNNYTILNVLLKNINISPSVTYDEDLLAAIIAEINSQLPNKVINSDYYVDGDNLIITSGKDGIIVDETAFKNKMLYFLNNINIKDSIIEIPVVNTKATKIDLDAIYKAIYKDPVDAYYTTNPYVVHPSTNGLDFNISMEEAKKLISSPQEEYTIPLKITYPKVTTKQIGSEAFPDLLSQFTTSFTSSGANRATNVRLAAGKINGTVLMPGETFSYNQVVGKRTRAAGFREGTAYFNGQVVQEVGGGICQVSSTLYDAVLYANLEIVERYNHGFNPGYVKAGLDATVSWGGPDFKFKNNRNYPIRIVCDSSGKKLRIYIYGLKTPEDCTVVLDARYLSTIPYKTIYQTDPSLATGESKVIQSGSNGCKTATYKYVYNASGTLISSDCISRDTYNPHNKVVAVGP